MGRAIELLLLALVSLDICEAVVPVVAAACNVPNMSACNTSAWANMTLAAGPPANKKMMCETRDILETCTLIFGANCDPTQRGIFKQATADLARVVNVQNGFDCSRTLASSTPEPLQASSGDSGSGSASSGSNEIIGSAGSGAYKWQWWAVILTVFACCMVALCGLAAVLMGQRKNKRSKRMDRDYEIEQPPPLLEQQYAAPPAVDYPPQALEPPPVEIEAPVPVAVPIVESQPMTDTEKLYLFGQPQPSMLQSLPTASMTQTQSYDEARSLTYPMSSYYTQAPGSYYVAAQEQPSVYYAQPATQYAQPTTTAYTYAAAEPQYTTAYAVNPGYQPQYAAGQVI
jgi:hypothetical protein